LNFLKGLCVGGKECENQVWGQILFKFKAQTCFGGFGSLVVSYSGAHIIKKNHECITTRSTSFNNIIVVKNKNCKSLRVLNGIFCVKIFKIWRSASVKFRHGGCMTPR